MKKIYYILVMLLSTQVFSQNVPKVTVKDGADLELTNVWVTVDIVGNLAITTYNMKFYNGLNRTLEGELVFPLGEGQTVSGFSMDVNGKMRDAVIVEKELGRVAYETTIRRKIDPGLLEKTEGNNYKARIYPIFPKRGKQIVLKFEQELSTLDGKQSYALPLGITKSLKNFSVTMNVFSEQVPVVTKSKYKDFFFQKKEEAYTATITKENHAPTEPIVIQIPNQVNQDHIATYNGYFHYYKSLEPTSRLKEKPEKLTILWDASYSMRYRNVEKEWKVLESYLDYLQDVKVNFIVFSNTIHTEQTFRVKDGDATALFQAIQNVQYDGGTKLNLFENVAIKADEVLLFSDGLANLGDFAIKRKLPIYAINSLVSANHQHLIDITTQSGGSYLNLLRLDHAKAAQLLKKETYQFLGVNHDGNVREVYPKRHVNVYQDFSVSGQFSSATTIELLFGYGGKVTEKIPVKIEVIEGTKAVKRLWAKQKLSELNRNKEENKEAIISLAKRYSLITDYTSLIILDRIQDYVRYKIEPPKELMADYKRLLTWEERREEYRLAVIKRRRRQLDDKYKKIDTWYGIDHILENEANLGTGEKMIITGTITDNIGEPLPGASVVIKGTTGGVTSDFDGNYAIEARRGQLLTFSYVGYSRIEAQITSARLDVKFEEDPMLEEVVVTAYGSMRTRKEGDISISRVLQGSASGVRISGADAESMEEVLRGSRSDSGESEQQLEKRSEQQRILIRGRSMNLGNAKPLIVVDGEVIDENAFRKIAREEIENVNVLKHNAATALYGNRGANGVIIITTKTGLKENRAKIEAHEKAIADKITLKPWNSEASYIKELENATIASAYQKYLEIREEYTNMPTFYLDVADFFHAKEATEIAVTVITNLLEVELHNYELLKAAAYKLEYFERYDMAVLAFEKVLELRPEEPQSYRDLALAYEQIGEIQKSYDLLYKLYSGELIEKYEEGRFSGIESITYVELTRLVHKYPKKLKLSKEERSHFPEMPMDVRVVIDWNHNDTDIDLWVFDPNDEKAFYMNKNTKIGGRMSEDLRNGYGPETFLLKNAVKGQYEVHVNYFSDRVQKISGPTILKVTMYTNYGKKNETKKALIVRLEKKHDTIKVGDLLFN